MTSLNDRMDMFLTKLKGVKPSGKGYMACCPAHDDKNPSLWIAPGTIEDTIVFDCKAGCTKQEVLSAVGLTFSDLYPESSIRERQDINRERLLEHEKLVLKITLAAIDRGEDVPQTDLDRAQLAIRRLQDEC